MAQALTLLCVSPQVHRYPVRLYTLLDITVNGVHKFIQDDDADNVRVHFAKLLSCVDTGIQALMTDYTANTHPQSNPPPDSSAGLSIKEVGDFTEDVHME